MCAIMQKVFATIVGGPGNKGGNSPMMPAVYVAAISVGLFVVLLVCMIIKHKSDKTRGLYTPAICSICQQPSGVQGNRCFKLIGGCICESCASKLMPNIQMQNLTYDWFLKNSKYNTVDDAMRIIHSQDHPEQVISSFQFHK